MRNTRRVSILFVTMLLLFTASQTYAQTPTTEEKILLPNQKQEELQKKREETKELIIQKQEELKKTREETKQLLLERKEMLKEQQKELKEVIQAKREEAQERNQEKREAFKARLETIKDEQKKAIVERIDEKLATLNTKQTDHMLEILEKLSSLLERIIEKTNQAKEQGKDTTTIETTITNAQTAITTAQTAVSTQAGKTYTAQIQDETTLKNTIGTTVKQFQTDLQTTRKTVIDAKQAVQNVIKELGKENNQTIPTATVTATP